MYNHLRNRQAVQSPVRLGRACSIVTCLSRKSVRQLSQVIVMPRGACRIFPYVALRTNSSSTMVPQQQPVMSCADVADAEIVINRERVPSVSKRRTASQTSLHTFHGRGRLHGKLARARWHQRACDKAQLIGLRVTDVEGVYCGQPLKSAPMV